MIWDSCNIDVRRDKSVKPNGKLNWDILPILFLIGIHQKIKDGRCFTMMDSIVIFSGRNDRGFLCLDWLVNVPFDFGS